MSPTGRMKPIDGLDEFSHPLLDVLLFQSYRRFTGEDIHVDNFEERVQVASCGVGEEEMEMGRREEGGDELWDRNRRLRQPESQDIEFGPR